MKSVVRFLAVLSVVFAIGGVRTSFAEDPHICASLVYNCETATQAYSDCQWPYGEPFTGYCAGKKADMDSVCEARRLICPHIN